MNCQATMQAGARDTMRMGPAGRGGARRGGVPRAAAWAGVALVAWASWAAPLEAAGAGLKVTGMSWWRNFEMQRVLQHTAKSEETGDTWDAGQIEDSLILLRSRLEERGFLEPRVEVVLTTPQGEEQTHTWNPDTFLAIDPAAEAVGLTFRIERGPQYFFAGVEIEGLVDLTEEEAAAFFYPRSSWLSWSAPRAYSPNKVRAGLANLREHYRAKGYREAAVQLRETDLDPATGAVWIKGEVSTGPRYGVGAIEVVWEGSRAEETGFLEATRAQLEEAARAEAGAAFSPAWEAEFRRQARSRLFLLGYPDARVEIQPEGERTGEAEDTLTVDLRAVLDPGPRVRVGDIRWEGLVRTRESVVRSQPGFSTGDWLVPQQVDEARRRVSNLGVFTTVQSRLGEGLAASQPGVETRDLTFILEEQRVQDFWVRVGYGSYEKIRAGLDFERRNVFGMAHRLRGSARASLKSQWGEARYTLPEWRGRPIQIDLKADAMRREEVSFTREEMGVSAGLNYFWQERDLRLQASYHLELLDSKSASAELRRTGDDQARSGSLEYGLLRDRRDNPAAPSRGYRFRLKGETALEAFGADTEYQGVDAQFSWHRKFGTGWWGHLGLAHGAVFSLAGSPETVPLNKQYFPGGENSIRGYAEGQASFRGPGGGFVGSGVYFLGNLEVEREILPQVMLVIFSDHLVHGRTGEDFPGDEYLTSLGLGLRYRTPLGPLRVEYGSNLNPRPGDPSGTLHFSLGFPF